MAGALFLVACVLTLGGAGWIALSENAMARRVALPSVVGGLATLAGLAGADLAAFVLLAAGLAVGLVLQVSWGPEAAPRRADGRVLPGALAVVAFASLYFAIVRGRWPRSGPEEPLAQTSALGARLLTTDLAALVLVILFLAGAVAGAMRLGSVRRRQGGR